MSKLINQGSFGCIYRPNIQCNDNDNKENENTNNSPNSFLENSPETYISKIQLYSKQEEEISKFIRTQIPRHHEYFAPIVSSCNIDIGKIDKDELEKCKILHSHTQEQTKPATTGDTDNAVIESNYKSSSVSTLGDSKRSVLNHQGAIPVLIYNDAFRASRYKSSSVSNKIRYIGKKTLGKELVRIGKYQPQQLLKKMIQTHIHLLQGIQQLLTAPTPIVHYDVKENNIMYEESTGNPIIIDFGISLQPTTLSPENYKSGFYVYSNKYPCWCMEILLINYIVHTKPTPVTYQEQLTHQDIINLQKIVEEIIQENPTYKNEVITQEERTNLQTETNNYISTFESKTWQQLMDVLLQTYPSWDNYSISVIYLTFMVDIFIHGTQPIKNPCIESYIEIVKSIVLTPPNKPRKTPTETIELLYNTFSKQSKKEHNKLIYEIIQLYKHHSQEKIRRMYYQSLKQLEADEKRGAKSPSQPQT
jgi:hypothetical protein